MRSSAKRMGRELKGQARRAFGGGPPERVEVWEAATAEPLPGEAPECAWCPVCRAARRFRQSGPGFASQVAGAGDALLTVAQDTLAAFEATLSGRPPGSAERPHEHPAQSRPAAASPGGTGWPAQTDAGQPDAPAPPAGTIGSGEAVRSGGLGRPGEAASSGDADTPGDAASTWGTATAGETAGRGETAPDAPAETGAPAETVAPAEPGQAAEGQKA
jgi:hypothetical protein